MVSPRSLLPRLLGCTAALLVALGCDKSPPTGPTMGDLQVTAATTGPIAALDPDGYLVQLDNEAGQAITTKGGAVSLAKLSPGTHSVRLSGLASNCSVSGANPYTVTVVKGETAEVAFAVRCMGPGAVQISATTSGTDLPTGGYIVTVDGGVAQPLPTNGGSVTVHQLAVGPHSVALSGVAANCAVLSPNPARVTVPTEAPVSATFSISCYRPLPAGSVIAFASNRTGNSEIFLIRPGASLVDLTNSSATDASPA